MSEFQLVEINARVPLFLQTPGVVPHRLCDRRSTCGVRSRLPNAKYVPYAKYGLIAYGTGLIVRDELIAKSPDLVKKFVAATQKGWEASLKDPEAAVTASLKLYPDIPKELLRDGLKIVLEEQLHTPSTQGHPIGWTDEGDWKRMIDMLKTYAGMKAKEPSAYYTNKFIAN